MTRKKYRASSRNPSSFLVVVVVVAAAAAAVVVNIGGLGRRPRYQILIQTYNRYRMGSPIDNVKYVGARTRLSTFPST